MKSANVNLTAEDLEIICQYLAGQLAGDMSGFNGDESPRDILAAWHEVAPVYLDRGDSSRRSFDETEEIVRQDNHAADLLEKLLPHLESMQTPVTS